MTRASALVVALLLAGCAAPGPPGTPPISAFASLALGVTVRIDGVPPTEALGGYLEEGLVAVTPDGKTVLACFHGRFDQFSPAYVSRDEGATWSRIAFPVEGGVSGDCAVTIMEDGAWVFLGSTVVGATVLVSGDDGRSWSVNPLSAVPVEGWADRPWIAGVGSEIWLSYMPAEKSPGRVAFTKSTDRGATWSTPVSIGDAGASTAAHGAFAEGSGTVCFPMVRALAFQSARGTAASLEEACSSNGGTSWTVEQVRAGTDIVMDWPGLAITPTGHHVVAYTAWADEARVVQALIRAPGATTWSDPVHVHGARGNQSMWPFVDAGAGSNVTWTVSDLNPDAELLWLGRLDAATLASEEWLLDTAAIEFVSVDHDARGDAYVAWSTWEQRSFVQLAEHRGPAGPAV